MTEACQHRAEVVDRSRFDDPAFAGTWLDLEIDEVTPRLVVMRMVRRGRLATGEIIESLADFRYVLPRNQWCGVARADELDADDPRYPRPYVEPGDEAALKSRVSAEMLMKLAVRSSEIIVLGGGLYHPFRGLVARGRLIRCEQKEHAYANDS